MDVASLIRSSRDRAALSQRELGRRAGTSAAAVCLYEQGQRVPRTDTLARLLAGAGATLDVRVRWETAELDLERSGRVLVELLEVGDRLPRGARTDLAYPSFPRAR
ncbi:MAG: helix-turn-helix domain-containing protein [Acidimicrobiales bacterium]